MPHASFQNIDLFYEIDGSGPPVVLIAGMLSDSASWGPMIAPLSQSFQVIRPDNRTTGRTTPALAPTSPEQNADDIARLLDHLDLPKAHIVGHSMGGYIAAELAARHAGRVLSLTQLCSAPVNLPRSWHLFQTFCDIRRSGPEGLWLKALFPWLFHHRFFETPDNIEGAVAASLAYAHAQSLEAMQLQLDALRSYRPLSLDPRITAPRLALLAKDDLIVPHDEAHAVLAQTSAEIHSIAQAGHSLHWDAPEAVLSHLLPFLETVDDTASKAAN